MMSARRAHSLLSSTTVTYTFQNDHSTASFQPKTMEIPIYSPTSAPPQSIPITVHFPTTSDPSTVAATKIQSSYRSHVIRTLYKKISAVNSGADRLQLSIQRQETVDAVRSDERERIKMNEALMGLLFRLDEIPGVNPTLREVRRRVSRRIVGLQEILDAVSGCEAGDWVGYLEEWDDVVEKMEGDVCRERGGGYEMERFCAEKLGFRCLQRFLRDQW